MSYTVIPTSNSCGGVVINVYNGQTQEFLCDANNPPPEGLPCVVATIDEWASGYRVQVIEVSANLSINSLHNGKSLMINSNTDITLTLSKDMSSGFSCIIDQANTGKALFAGDSGVSIFNRSGFDRTAGEHAIMTAFVRSNIDGNSAVWILAGDGSTP